MNEYEKEVLRTSRQKYMLGTPENTKHWRDAEIALIHHERREREKERKRLERLAQQL